MFDIWEITLKKLYQMKKYFYNGEFVVIVEENDGNENVKVQTIDDHNRPIGEPFVVKRSELEEV